MKTYVTLTDFVDTFKQGFGGQYKDNFSHGGLKALFDYFEDYEDDTQEEIQFDAIAIACEWAEYESLEKFNEDYGTEFETLEDLRYETIALPFVSFYSAACPEKFDGFVVQSY